MKTALIVGVGEATGASACRNLAPDHQVGLVARTDGCIGALASELNCCEAFRCDVGDTLAWGQTLNAIEATMVKDMFEPGDFADEIRPPGRNRL